jgi:hypothetical protein
MVMYVHRYALLALQSFHGSAMHVACAQVGCARGLPRVQPRLWHVLVMCCALVPGVKQVRAPASLRVGCLCV